MTSKIFRAIFLVATLVLVASLVLIMGVLYGYFSDARLDQLADETRIAAQGVEKNGVGFFDGFVSNDARITLIDINGEVLYDSEGEISEMENHADREEFTEAIENGEGDATRLSSTLMTTQMYYAKRLSNGKVIRLSTEHITFLTMTLSMMQPIIIIMFAMMIGALLLAMRLSKKIVEPFNSVNLDEPLKNEGYDEIAPLLHKIDVQQRKIRSQKAELSMRKKEFAAVTDKMSEGLVLLSVDANIISINRAASFLLETSVECEGQNFVSVCRLPSLQVMIGESASGRRAEQIAELRGREYKFSANPVFSDDKITGIVLLILDVTENVDAEKMRREFSANVSHELKTPLQTISGCAELLSNGLVKAEDVLAFSTQIYSEAQRMIALVQDIISLSHLDEGAEDMQREDFDLYAVCNEVVGALESEAQSAAVTMDISGESVQINGIRRLVSVIVTNLCDNAIKYNRENGSVRVRVFKENGYAVLHVADTGIGIPKEDCERIFERFYRVDKSRSKKVGGTGLGLSIVKHAAKLHNANLSIDSSIGEGTSVTVKFPMK
ncbi:MAG: PAS domain-containing sensor histidine kinase [Clostridia bacterium]|nr:PAS domain-containing sensor histidine kinase [Clostridia bacterium]